MTDHLTAPIAEPGIPVDVPQPPAGEEPAASPYAPRPRRDQRPVTEITEEPSGV